MSFNRYLNINKQDNKTTAVDKFVKFQNEEQEIVKNIENLTFNVNHKSNIFKILRTNKNLNVDECKDLTILIDEYFSKNK